MAVRVEDVLWINIVLVGIELLKTGPEIDACSAAIGRDLVQEGGIIDLAPQMEPIRGRRLRLPRERILIDVSEHRSRITKEYPADIEDVTLVGQIAAQALATTTVQKPGISAHGFNLSMVYSDESGEEALRYLGRRIFARPTFVPENWSSFGGQGTLTFSDGTRTWTITLEPRLQVPSKVFLNINLHAPEARVPQEDEMQAGLRMLWEQGHSLIKAIHANVND